jgi:hypothetical protein
MLMGYQLRWFEGENYRLICHAVNYDEVFGLSHVAMGPIRSYASMITAMESHERGAAMCNLQEAKWKSY